MKHQCRRTDSQKGTVLVLVVVALVAVIGMVGLAIDVGALYATKQKAQAAADAAAQAGVMDLYNGTGKATASATSYAQLNGFNTAADTVTVDYPACAVVGCANVTLSGSDATNLIRVTVQRTVSTSLMNVLGIASNVVKAQAIAAIAVAPSPIPIIVIHPTLSGSFSTNGSVSTTICGGPNRALQINSSSPTSVSISGSGTIDLSHAGPKDAGNCVAGTGADFANVGAETPFPGTLLLGTKPGIYIEPSSPIQDPLINVAAPAQPAAAPAPASYSTTATETAHNCPTSCTVYSPGYYASGISPSGFSVFRPGIYWINHGGFSVGSNTIVRMATAAADESDPTTGTGWTSGMLIYNSPSTPVSSGDILNVKSNSGKMPGNNTYPTTDCPNGGNCLVGSPSTSSYKGILFFQNRATATSLSHSLSGGSGLSVTGTIYATHTAASINSDHTYQSMSLQGNSGSVTTVKGEVIVDVLSLGGSATLTMSLIGTPTFQVRQVALVQ